MTASTYDRIHSPAARTPAARISNPLNGQPQPAELDGPLPMLSDAEQQAADDIESVIQHCNLAAEGAAGRVVKAIAMARAIQALRKLVTDRMVADYFMPLMNTRLGFKTDRDPNRNGRDGKPPYPYPAAVVKECVIEAMLRGAYPVGNEFNIIAGGPYLTKEYFIRAVRQLEGVTDVVLSPGLPLLTQGRMAIRFGVCWKKNGIKDFLKDAEGKPGRVFEIKHDGYSSADQIVGKATRKALAAAYQQITGSEITLPEGDVDDLAPVNGVIVGDAKARTERMLQEIAQDAPADPPEADQEPTRPPEPPEQDDSAAAGMASGPAERAPCPDLSEQDKEQIRLGAALSGHWAGFKQFLWSRATAVAPSLTRAQFETEMRLLVGALRKTGREETISAGTRRRWYDDAQEIFRAKP